MGARVWVPLVFGENGLRPGNGFNGQAEVMIKTHQVADRVGATMMDRPEWVAANPKKPGEVHVTLTNTCQHGQQPDAGR